MLNAILVLRKTITGSDVVNAMTDMEFDKFVRPLENSLASKSSPRENRHLVIS